MNKSEVIAAMSEKSGLSKKKCEDALDAFVTSIGDGLKNGSKVKLLGFGTFEVKQRAARIGRDLRTKAPVNIPASRQPVFRPGKALKEVVL